MANSQKDQEKVLSLPQILKIPGVKIVLITFLAYCGLEATTGLWASSYLVEFRGIDAETAARFSSLFYMGITLGRFLSGFIADRFGDKILIRYGIIIIIFGVVFLGLPTENTMVSLIGLIIIGFGCAPVYPSIIHSTPANFGSNNSQSIIGVEMASAYIGTTFMPHYLG